MGRCRTVVSACVLLVLAAWSAEVAAQAASVAVASPGELLAAIRNTSTSSILITKPMALPTGWGPAVVTRPVTITSAIRAVIDFCVDAACDDEATWPATQAPRFIVKQGGQLSFSRLFFRHWIPPMESSRGGGAAAAAGRRRLLARHRLDASGGRALLAANGSTLDFENSPVPFVASAGGAIDFHLVVLHFTPKMTWVFDNATLSPSAFWPSAAATRALLGVNSTSGGDPLQLERPQLYAVKRYSVDGNAIVADCYVPMDLNGCYGGQAFDSQLVYCPYTLRDSLRNRWLRNVYLFHDIGLDRLVWQPWTRSSVSVAHSVTYQPCPGTQHVVDLDNVTSSALITTGGQLTFKDLIFQRSKVDNRTGWPGGIPLLLSPFVPTSGGSVSLVNCTVRVHDAAAVAGKLAQMPAGVSASPENPDLRPVYLGSAPTPGQALRSFTIASWRLKQQQWLFFIGDAASAATAGTSAWLFSNTVVETYDAPNCYNGAILQGSATVASIVHVSTGAELLAAIGNATARYIELDASVTIDAANANAAGLSAANRLVEVRACAPAGSMYVVDWGDLDDVVSIAGAVVFNGDMRMRGLGWQGQGLRPLQLINALHPSRGAVIEVEDVTLEGVLSVEAYGSDNGAGAVASLIGLATLSSVDERNVTVLSSDALMFSTYLVNGSVSDLVDMHGLGLGSTSLIDATLQWAATAPPPPEGPPLGAIVGGTLGAAALLAGAAGLIVLLSRRRRAAALVAAASAAKASEFDVEGANGSGSAGSQANSTTNPFLCKLASSGNINNSSIGMQSSASRARSGPGSDIAEACRVLAAARAPGEAAADGETLVLESVLGEGSYGKVYKGYWKGTVVAVKIMLLPTYMTGKEKREKMAVMETAISSSLSHPNIVQTYTYAVEPVTGKTVIASRSKLGGPNAVHMSLHDSSCSLRVRQVTGGNTNTTDASNASDVTSWEVRLVQEYCDKGTLRDALTCQDFHANSVTLLHEAGGAPPPPPPRPDGSARSSEDDYAPPHMLLMMDTALDVVRAMAHLHSQNIVHSDLKARNVLLKASFSDWRGFVAKVADFGLSLRLDPNDTHISNMYQGTMTHMAPETLLHGHISKSSDVYAFGILLWELYTGAHAHRGMPRALLGHGVAKQGLRPRFPEHAPFDLQLLACRCWETDPNIRPSFDQVLEELKRMREALAQAAPSAHVTAGGAAPPAPSSGAAAAAVLGIQSVLYRLEDTETGWTGATMSTDMERSRSDAAVLSEGGGRAARGAAGSGLGSGSERPGPPLRQDSAPAATRRPLGDGTTLDTHSFYLEDDTMGTGSTWQEGSSQWGAAHTQQQEQEQQQQPSPAGQQ